MALGSNQLCRTPSPPKLSDFQFISAAFMACTTHLLVFWMFQIGTGLAQTVIEAFPVQADGSQEAVDLVVASHQGYYSGLMGVPTLLHDPAVNPTLDSKRLAVTFLDSSDVEEHRAFHGVGYLTLTPSLPSKQNDSEAGTILWERDISFPAVFPRPSYFHTFSNGSLRILTTTGAIRSPQLPTMNAFTLTLGGPSTTLSTPTSIILPFAISTIIGLDGSRGRLVCTRSFGINPETHRFNPIYIEIFDFI
ncbi:hypothetical protein BV22DRAFT_175449 [Leucogyrophana mollusca]|uniref:Uncharacterized protein n=1 Tax=Leucogyrophana mollusca TaxID=85980 RepID=A0ACB8BTW6_9AGAM|nr:hypothetical protein BV22DRAFT_175449 [Leucogyrophana mollusca]